MAKKSNPNTNAEKRAAILKELESVRSMLQEEARLEDQQKGDTSPRPNKKAEEALQDIKEEYQIPLLDPAKPTTYELDFSKPAVAPPPPDPERERELNPPEPGPEDIPTIDDIAASSSLFDDEEENKGDQDRAANKVNHAELRDHAQLILQDLLNDAISEIEEKLDDWIPRLEIKLQKRLQKAIDQYIDDALNK